jgi:hypothetical protein
MKSGYRTAYRLADNFETFEQKFDQWTSNCITRGYGSIFDARAIAKLTLTQRRFLLLPQQL